MWMEFVFKDDDVQLKNIISEHEAPYVLIDILVIRNFLSSQ